jgi:hypothetical protein
LGEKLTLSPNSPLVALAEVADKAYATANRSRRQHPKEPKSQTRSALLQTKTGFRCAFSLDKATREEWEKLNTALLAELEQVMEDAGEEPKEEGKKEEVPAENNEAPKDGGGKP